jgi:NAD(P)H-hydrate repair Nnr-like enzyme with NAD(P)H-hydrate dehydratase domain
VEIQRDRIDSARAVAQQYGALCVLKGSGTVTATPSGRAVINNSGNGRLATAGTGDVLAGMLGAALARPRATNSGPLSHYDDLKNTDETTVLSIVTNTVWQHGHVADGWGKRNPTLTANRLSNALRG